MDDFPNHYDENKQIRRIFNSRKEPRLHILLEGVFLLELLGVIGDSVKRCHYRDGTSRDYGRDGWIKQVSNGMGMGNWRREIFFPQGLQLLVLYRDNMVDLSFPQSSLELTGFTWEKTCWEVIERHELYYFTSRVLRHRCQEDVEGHRSILKKIFLFV